MEDAGKVAIARVVIRSKENLVAIRPRDGVLAMETMLFADEVVPTDSLDEMTTDGDVKTTERELTMARQLIDSLSSDFEPEKYHDEYRERVLDLIERKAQGETIVIEEPTKEPEKVPDLMAALEASIAASKAGSASRSQARAQEAQGAGQEEGQPPRAYDGLVAATRVEVEVEGRRLSLSNLDKVLYPEVGFTKGQVIDYYTRIAPAVLPHLRDRPLTLKRYPNGVEGQYFYEKRCPSHAPDWVRREAVQKIEYCVCDDLPTLVWLANLADLELHPSLSKVDEVLRPTVMAFDLDPGPGAGLPECCEVAFILRDALAQLGLESFPKTSGSKGIQVYVPLNVDGVDYDNGTQGALARAGAAPRGAAPEADRVAAAKELRKDKVLIDWSQNDEHKTTVGVYSLRARERPTVSTPLAWDELEDPEALVFEAADVLERVDEHGDLFAPVAELQQELPSL